MITSAKQIKSDFNNTGYDIGLRNCLVLADRQGSVFVSPARQCLVYETVSGHTVHRIEYPLITNPLTRKTLHHSRTRSFTR
jgi:hypothetical protein